MYVYRFAGGYATNKRNVDVLTIDDGPSIDIFRVPKTFSIDEDFSSSA